MTKLRSGMIVVLVLLSSLASAKGPIQPWALMRYDTDKQTLVVQEIYETKAECEQWRQTQTGGVYACVKAVKKIPPPPDRVEIP